MLGSKRLLLPALGKAEATRGGCDRHHLNACSVGLWNQQNVPQLCIFFLYVKMHRISISFFAHLSCHPLEKLAWRYDKISSN